MFDKYKFKGKVVSKGMNLSNVAQHLGINKSTLSKKVNGGSDFYRSEIEALCIFLDIQGDEKEKIFFKN